MTASLEIKDILEKTYKNVFELLKLGEAKNTTLIVINFVIIIGFAVLLKDVNLIILKYYFVYIMAMCAISACIGFASLKEKLKRKKNEISLTESDDVLFFETIAYLTEFALVEKIKYLYELESINANYEYDLARQLVITSQIVVRKFHLFNLALKLMLFGLLTPVSIIIYYMVLRNHE